MTGQTVCKMHGGKTPGAVERGQRRAAEAKAAQLIGKVWDPQAPKVTNAIEEMQQLAGSMKRAVDVLGARISPTVAGREDDTDGALDLDPVVAAAWMRVLRELRQLLEGMQRLGIAERYVELEADRVRLMAVAVGKAFEVLGLDDAQRAIGTQVLLQTLRDSTPDLLAGRNVGTHAMSPTHEEDL